jgi:hypothetical protein
MRAVALLLLSACGGPPFTLAVERTDAVPVHTVAIDPPAPEAGEPEATTPDVMMVDSQGLQDAAMVETQEAASRDTRDGAMVETQDAVGSAQDAGPDVDVPEVPMGCGATLPFGSSVCGMYGVNVPSSYCLLTSASAYGGTMPGRCQCAATYTCACLMAAVHDPCGANGRFAGCVDGAKSVTVSCQ